MGKTKRGKGTKLMAVADRHGTPIAFLTASASPAEVHLAGEAVAETFVGALPEKLIGDKAYDSDLLDEEMAYEGIEMISPNRTNRRKRTQDGRKLRRYARRWKIERLFAWLQNFRKLVVRYEYRAENFDGMVQLALIVILLRRGF